MKTPVKYPIIIVALSALLIIFTSCDPFDDVHDNPANAKFSYTSEVLYPALVQFSNTSVSQPGTTSTYVWDFGDGSTSTTADPSHNYISAGSYTVKLVQIPSAGNNDTTAQTITLSPVTGPSGYSNRQQTASFQYAVRYTGYKANFINSSQFSAGFSWNFGDGRSSTTDSVMVTHVYPNPGTYHVVLSATGVSNTDTSGATISFQ